MILFLTSSPTGPLDGSRPVYGLDEMNGFVAQLKAIWPESARCLIITASPEEHERNDEMTRFFRGAVERSGLKVACFDLWDSRTQDTSAQRLCSYDVVFLGGGHVPTQADFFRRIGLKQSMQSFDGIVIGISAGSMNAAIEVYAQPEEPGETLDPNYPLFFPGLGLSEIQILPHYQMVKDNWLDGRRVFEDITYGDSYGRQFLVLPDGSYLLSKDGREIVYGESYCIADGKIYPICKTDEQCLLIQH